MHSCPDTDIDPKNLFNTPKDLRHMYGIENKKKQ